MPQHGGRLPDDEEANAESLALRGVDAHERVEDRRHVLFGNADSRVEDVNTREMPELPAAEQDTPSRFGVFDRISDQIVKGCTKQQSVTHNPRVAAHHANLN